jgi:hypothetical protein
MHALLDAPINFRIPTESARKVRTRPDFPKFADGIGLMRCWKIHGWPPQVQPKLGTDGSTSIGLPLIALALPRGIEPRFQP